VVLVGDYNVVPTPQDIYPTRSLDSNALIQPESRQAFARLLAQGWTAPCGSYIRTGHSRHSGITNLNGGRRTKAYASITFSLSPNLSVRLVDSGVDRVARKYENASGHAPTWIVLDL
jgi:exodeoxyribonuclease-3